MTHARDFRALRKADVLDEYRTAELTVVECRHCGQFRRVRRSSERLTSASHRQDAVHHVLCSHPVLHAAALRAAAIAASRGEVAP